MSQNISLDTLFSFISKAFEYLTNHTSGQWDFYLGLLGIGASIAILAIALYVIVIKPIGTLLSGYVNGRKAYARHRIEEVSAFAWGNSLLRAPLLAIGTDIYAFGLTSVRGKTIRYIKAASVFIPVTWCVFALVILLAGAMNKSVDWYVMGAPIILVAITIFILDVSIIAASSSSRVIALNCHGSV